MAAEEVRADAGPDDFTVAQRLRTVLSPPILVLIPIYGLGLIPATSVLAWLCTQLDARLGIPSLGVWLPWPLRVAAFVATLAVGGAIVAWSYTYLVLEGGGGPVPPFSATTCRLVTNGPYAWIRHPSIWGKLLGVVGLGILFASPTFLCGAIPLLLWWSLNRNMDNQDAEMEALFGEAWRVYRDATPRLVPRLGRR